MTDRNCKMCAKCYFIKENYTSVIPDAYQRLCESIGASTQIPIRGGFKTEAVYAVEAKTLDTQIIQSLQAKTTNLNIQTIVNTNQNIRTNFRNPNQNIRTNSGNPNHKSRTNSGNPNQKSRSNSKNPNQKSRTNLPPGRRK